MFFCLESAKHFLYSEPRLVMLLKLDVANKQRGEMAEWLKATVLKTVRGASPS